MSDQSQVDEIVWGEAPSELKSMRGQGRWQRFCDELKQKPGVWGSVTTETPYIAHAAAFRIRGHGPNPVAKQGDFEATVRNGVTLYARYIGQ